MHIPVKPHIHRLRQSLGIGLYRRSVAIFLATLVLFMVAMPFAQRLADPGLVEGPLAALMLITGVMAVGGRRNSLLLATLLTLPALVARWLYHVQPEPISHSVFLVLGSLVFILVVIQLLGFILRAPHVDSEVLFAGVATYLVLGMTWAMLYLLVSILDPNAFLLAGPAAAGNAFDGFKALYFSFVTITTMGYGDISPASPVARVLAVLEATTGVLYLAVLIARLVTLYTDKQA